MCPNARSYFFLVSGLQIVIHNRGQKFQDLRNLIAAAADAVGWGVAKLLPLFVLLIFALGRARGSHALISLVNPLLFFDF